MKTVNVKAIHRSNPSKTETFKVEIKTAWYDYVLKMKSSGFIYIAKGE